MIDKFHRMKRTTLSKAQLRGNLEALQALIDDRPIEYWSEVLKKWCVCEDCDTDFIHRVKPPHDDQTPPSQSQSQPASTKGPTVSTDVNDY